MNRFGAWNEGNIEFLAIVLDLSDRQIEEIEPVMAEQRERMIELRKKFGMGPGRDRAWKMKRMNRMHGRGTYDNVDRTEMRARMRRESRDFEKDREKFLGRVDRARGECDNKLEKILDEGQMKKLRELRDLRDRRREERMERCCGH